MPSSKPLKVSVLVPAFNEEANVQRAYDAIVDTFRELAGIRLRDHIYRQPLDGPHVRAF